MLGRLPSVLVVSAAGSAALILSRAAVVRSTPTAVLGNLMSKKFGPPVVMGDESLMSPKAHGTSATPVQQGLRWNCDVATADRICNFNRHYAEFAGYWETTTFLKDENGGAEIQFYDSNTGELLFSAPKNRSWEDFVKESKSHGWPSFRDDEVNWDYVRVLADGETVSTAGTHLGHNLPDGKGNRYCINLVSVAGKPTDA
mmetsp:Transcript_7409/g.19287  ORF Transcript_7409/g.19287 Transcript_7409/m.19287 type:complete len:200 (+) Transcript_7409:51-650(+)